MKGAAAGGVVVVGSNALAKEAGDANAVIDVRYPSAASTALNSVLKGHEGVYRWCAVLAGYNFAGTFLLFPLYGQFE